MHPDIDAALEVARAGALRGHSPGRTDNQNISVPAETFVCPADVVSALGEGNTEAGFRILEKLFPSPPVHHAKNGKVPIVAAQGEYLIPPEHVKRIGGGDMKAGHKALSEFVAIIRRKNIKAIKSMPKPAMG